MVFPQSTFVQAGQLSLLCYDQGDEAKGREGMTSADYERLLRQADGLSVEEQLRLAAYLVEKARQAAARLGTQPPGASGARRAAWRVLRSSAKTPRNISRAPAARATTTALNNEAACLDH